MKYNYVLVAVALIASQTNCLWNNSNPSSDSIGLKNISEVVTIEQYKDANYNIQLLTMQAEKQQDELTTLRDKHAQAFEEFKTQLQNLSAVCISDEGCEQDAVKLQSTFIADSKLLKAAIASKKNELTQTNNKIAETNAKLDAYVQQQTKGVVIAAESGTTINEELEN